MGSDCEWYDNFVTLVVINFDGWRLMGQWVVQLMVMTDESGVLMTLI